MRVSTEEKREEALKRLELLGVMKNVVRDFKKDVLNQSEQIGYLYWLDDKQKKIVEEFEKEHDALVYHVIHQYTNIGELLNFLYVSDCKEEWQMDIEDIRNGQALVYVENLTMPDCSEFGTIGIKPSIGGVVRMW